MILNAVDSVPDIFKTLLNVTADLSAAVMVARFSESESTADEVRRFQPVEM